MYFVSVCDCIRLALHDMRTNHQKEVRINNQVCPRVEKETDQADKLIQRPIVHKDG